MIEELRVERRMENTLYFTRTSLGVVVSDVIKRLWRQMERFTDREKEQDKWEEGGDS